jgi:putative salt-induced outer membrane protein YdiY
MKRLDLWAALCAAIAFVWMSGAEPVAAQPETVAAFEESHEDRPDPVLSFTASLGMVYATGNTNSWTLNGGTQFRLVRNRHALSIDWTMAYGRADLTPNDDSTGFVDTVRNSNGRARYDFYLTRNDALFVALAHRWDTFAGLDTRLQAQAGYLRNIIQKDKHRLWTEIGYDFTYDNYVLTQDPDTAMLPECADTVPLDMRPANCIVDGQNVHAARAFVGYDNHLASAVHFTAGLEALFNLQDGDDIRLNLDAAVVSTLTELFKLEVKFKLLFDNVPVPGKTKTDTLLTVNLVFNWERENPPPPAAEPAAEEAPAEPAAEEAPADEPAAEEAPAEEPATEEPDDEAPTDETTEDTAADTEEAATEDTAADTEEAAAEGDAE